MNNMGISQPSFAFDGDQTNFVELVTRGITGPPKGVFPHMPNRTQWNRDWPHLHTIECAIRHIVDDAAMMDEPVSPPMVRQILIDMGFGEHDVRRTVQAVLGASKNGFVKVIRRDIPEDGGKSWSMYTSCHEAAFRINEKDIKLAAWLQYTNNVQRLDAVNAMIQRYGAKCYLDHPDAQQYVLGR